MKIAIPTMGAGGLDCERSGHFGHCDCFTVVTVEDGKIVATDIIDNPPHEEGGCLRWARSMPVIINRIGGAVG